MRIKSHFATLVLFTSSVVCATPTQFGASLADVHDSNNDNSLDFDASYAPTDLQWLNLGAGIGSAKSASPAGDLSGTTLRALVGIESGPVEVRGYYRNWNTGDYDTNTAGGRASLHEGGLTLTAIGEHRAFDVDYDTGATSGPQSATAHFTGTGWGGGLNYQESGWSGYAEAIFYHYHSLAQYVPAQSAVPAGTPGSPGVPGITLPIIGGLTGPVSSRLPSLAQTFATVVPTLSGSFVTVTQGALTHLLTAGVERDFTNSLLRVDWTGAKDAVFGTKSNSYSLGYRYSFTRLLNAGVTVGTTRSRDFSTNFGGVSVGMNF